MIRASRDVLAAVSACAIATGASVLAGPLNPPAGPVASTHKTLTEVEPRTAINATNTPGDANSYFRITQPGSYYLTANMSVGTIEHGIQIDLNTEGLVTIDLNGFTVSGAEGTLNGIDVDGPFKPRVVLRNGFVTSFGGNGVDMTGAENCTIENIESTRNTGKGFVIETGSIADAKAQFNSGGGFKTGSFSSLSNCQALTTGPIGFETDTDCSLVDCTAKGTTGNGFDCDSNCVLTRCIATNCGGHGILVFLGCTLTDCTASNNAEGGFSVNQSCTLIGCTAVENTKWGFSSGGSVVYQSCTARDNGFHGFAASFSQLTECHSIGNKLDGFALGGLTNVSNCTASSNTGNGFSGGGGMVIVECSALYNAKHGVWASGDGNIIHRNNCTGNGQGTDPGSGIHADGIANRIEDNLCRDNDYGIRVLGTRNNIVRNNCGLNTTANWSIAANNSYGPIIDRSAAVTPAVNGNNAAAALGSTDPNANFTN